MDSSSESVASYEGQHEADEPNHQPSRKRIFPQRMDAAPHLHSCRIMPSASAARVEFVTAGENTVAM
jgi:hypothetical protein